jgi:hypothetical protein
MQWLDGAALAVPDTLLREALAMLIYQSIEPITFHCAVILIGLATTGCGASSVASHVEPDLARNTLTRVLDGWKSGQSPDAWRHRDPQIVVQDRDWMGGAKLLSYEFVGSGEARDANLVCTVKLQMQKSGQRSVEETVTYFVGTDPVLTVFRAL